MGASRRATKQSREIISFAKGLESTVKIGKTRSAEQKAAGMRSPRNKGDLIE